MRSLGEIAPLVSATAFVFSAVLVVLQLRNTRRDRFVAVTNTLFQIWASPDFMAAQLWLIYEMNEKSWEEFRQQHHGKDGEAAFLRVTGFYNRVGTLVRLNLVDSRLILRTIGSTADAVWNKVEPFLKEARQQNPLFLADYERLVPCCGKAIGPAVSTAR